MARVIAVDCSGKEKRASESIWRLVAVDGQLLEIRYAFEAAVSAVTMTRQIQELESSVTFPAAWPKRIEGCIWEPAVDTAEA
jgi:hypothetical protein